MLNLLDLEKGLTKVEDVIRQHIIIIILQNIPFQISISMDLSTELNTLNRILLDIHKCSSDNKLRVN